MTVFILLSASSRMIRIILHLSVLVIIQPSSKPFQRVFTLFLSNFVKIPMELYSSIYFKLLFPHSFHRRNQLYLMDNVNKPKWESCINRREFAICTEKTCHSIGDFPPPRRPPSTKKLCRQSHRQSSEILIFYFGYWNIVLL